MSLVRIAEVDLKYNPLSQDEDVHIPYRGPQVDFRPEESGPPVPPPGRGTK